MCQVDFSLLFDPKEGISLALLNVELRGILPRDLWLDGLFSVS